MDPKYCVDLSNIMQYGVPLSPTFATAWLTGRFSAKYRYTLARHLVVAGLRRLKQNFSLSIFRLSFLVHVRKVVCGREVLA